MLMMRVIRTFLHQGIHTGKKLDKNYVLISQNGCWNSPIIRPVIENKTFVIFQPVLVMSQRLLDDHIAEKPRESGDIRTSCRIMTFSRYYTEEKHRKDESDLKLINNTKMKCLKLFPWNISVKRVVTLLTAKSTLPFQCLTHCRCSVIVKWVKEDSHIWNFYSVHF